MPPQDEPNSNMPNPTNRKVKVSQPKVHVSKRQMDFSLRQLLLFVLVFAAIGGYFLYRSFAAAPVVATLEAEQMTLPSGGSVITDSSASGGKAIKLLNNGTASGSVSFPSSVSSLTVTAKGDQCAGAPTMNVSLDGHSLLTSAVSATAWSSYSLNTTQNSGTHTLSLTFSGDYTKSKGNSGKNACSRNLYADVTTFYGPAPPPTPAPTVTLSASPTSVSAGGSSTLTWASTNATSCTASGAWSGTEPTSGSTSTGALNQTSTYSLSCTGAGGSATASVTVTVQSAGIQIPSTIANDCSVDVTSSLLTWISSVPNNSVLQFGTNKCYRIEGTLEIRGRSGLTFEGNGSSFKSLNPMTSGSYTDDQRAMWRIIDSTNFVFHNMVLNGAYTHGGTLDATIQHAHAIDLRGTSAEVSNITMTNFAGDCVYFGLGYTSALTQSSGSFHDSSCKNIGRNAASFTAAHDVTVQRVTTDKVGYTAFDLEPNIGSGWGTKNIKIDGNTIGSYYLYAFAVIMNAPDTNDSFTNNKIVGGKGLRIGIVNPGAQSFRPYNVTISGNSADTATTPPAIEVHNTDILSITGNTVPMTNGTMATVDKSCKASVSSNSYPGGTNEVTITNPVPSC